ncbi:MAG TPA: LysM peptidoglycan-binding domain-containing protein, partial [Anaerolineales bacterium]|nr:LysM peptidoglycan-binding domain-containing protein [Anaerolineales bacterium]
HSVESYQTLSTIATAYQVTVDNILAINGLQIDWPLQIGQNLLISPGTVLSPLEKLTPASDGNYYHTVQSGQTLSGIARLYDLSLANLMAWNGLNADSIIVPGQKLLLIVTPPATRTSTPSPVTSQAGGTALAATVTPTPSISSPTQTPTPIALNPTIPVTSVPQPAQFNREFLLGVVLAVGGLTVLVMLVFRKRPQSRDT